MAVSTIDPNGLNIGQIGGTRNKVINGAMTIDQRNAGASVTPTADVTYTLDRWNIRNFGNSGRFSVQRTTASVPLGFSHSAVLTVTTADATNNGAYSFCQRIEGFNSSDLGLGSTTAKSITISFWVRSSVTGTYCVSLRNKTATESYVAEYSISVADTWEYKTVSLPTVASGTWEVTNDQGILLDFVLGSNTGRETTAGAWQSGNFISTANQTEWIATSGATFYITGVQLEAGDTATPFEHRSYGQELALCQRYFHRIERGGTWTIAAEGTWATSGGFQSAIFFPVQMRVPPTFSYSGTGTWDAVYNASATASITGTISLIDNADGRAALLSGTANSGTTPGIGAGGGTRIQTNTAGEYMQFDAEL